MKNKYLKGSIILVFVLFIALLQGCSQETTTEQTDEMPEEIRETYDQIEVVTNKQQTITESDSQDKDEVLISSIGKAINNGKLKMIINEVDFVNAVGDFQVPERNEIVVIDLTVENLLTEKQTFYSMAQVKLTDKDGYSYFRDADILLKLLKLDRIFPDGEILPQMKNRGKVGFVVPKDVTDLKAIINFEIVGGDSVIINIK